MIGKIINVNGKSFILMNAEGLHDAVKDVEDTREIQDVINDYANLNVADCQNAEVSLTRIIEMLS